MVEESFSVGPGRDSEVSAMLCSRKGRGRRGRLRMQREEGWRGRRRNGGVKEYDSG